MTNIVRLLFVLFSLALASRPSIAATLRAGVAKVDITPAGNEVLWGYESRLAPATSTLDPLYARVLVVEVGERRLALVRLGLGRSFGPAALARLREASKRAGGISLLLAAASPTHSALV